MGNFVEGLPKDCINHW